jgi:hypothetical protein
MIAETNCTKARKFRVSLSQRVEMARKCLSLLKKCSTRFAFAIERVVAGPGGLAIGLGRNHRGDVAFGEEVDERVGVIGLLADQGVRIGVFEQQLGAYRMPRCQNRGPDRDAASDIERTEPSAPLGTSS